MSIKKKIASILFGQKSEETKEERPRPQAEQPEQEPAETLDFVQEDPALIKLPGEHPLYQLYNLRRKEAGGLPAPRLSMDEDGVLPAEMIRKEKSRLESALRNACNFRLKSTKNNGNKRKKEKKEEEEEEAKPQGLDAFPWFFLSSDKLYAWMLVLPPTGQGRPLSRDILFQSLDEQGISYGVDERLVDRLSHDENRYFTLFLIAKGKPAFDGKNGNIVDYFPRVIERVLEVDEYDQVDYTALNLIHNVKEGQEICRLIRPTEGEPGRTVLDQEIPAKSGKSVPLPKGRNTEISEDGDALVALSSGHVEFTGRSFQVKPVLDIDGDVDFSTGNIKFLGDVNIKGDVLSGFTVRAMGSVWVGGVIEAGSTVEAGGDLTVVKGILGDGTTTVRAHRCIFSKYVENATIYVKENLQTDAIINGNIYCDGDILVRSGRGTIMGGRVWAAKKVSATAVGSKSECRTAVTLGGLPCTNFEREQVQRELKSLEMELEKLECQLDSPVKASLLSKVRVKLNTAELRLQQLEEDLQDIQEELKEREEGRLECGVAYAGTEISIEDEMIRLRHEERQCVAKMVCGEIVVM
ncbi:MAG: FapA family protein [Oscillospiraceae bacterium]|nr:FapA family protein [Oscillospiraceae bacterium]